MCVCVCVCVCVYTNTDNQTINHLFWIQTMIKATQSIWYFFRTFSMNLKIISMFYNIDIFHKKF